jgi:hypothetical protein
MNLRSLFAAAVIAASGVVMAAQPGLADEKRVITVTGDIIRLEPSQHVIVVRDPSRGEVTYRLGPSVVLPAGVEVGRRVTLFTEPGADGSTLVSRVTTVSTTPEGNTKRTVEETRTTPAGDTTRTVTTTVSGTVGAFVPGKSITVKQEDGSEVTYILEPDSQIPEGLVTGRTVTIRWDGKGRRVARVVTYPE